MKKMTTVIFTFLCFGLISGLSSTSTLAANDENNILHVTLLNGTKNTLHFEKVLSANVGNIFNINPNTIAPGQTLVVTAEKTLKNDVAANLVFADEQGNKASLMIIDQEQVHIGQAVFHFSGIAYDSEILSKTRNKNIGSRYLTYLEASLKITKQSN